MRLRTLAFTLATALLPLASNAQAAPADPPAPAEAPASTEPALTTLETIVVTGIQPGPGLWQVHKDGRVLWIMATLSPLPKRIEWEPRELDALVARADRVLSPPRASIDADIGFFGRIGLIPSALRARNLPDDRTLAEVLPPELHARWETQKAKWIGRDRGVERRRPFIAAFELMDEALEDLDLERDNIVWDRVQRVAKRHDREIVTVAVAATVADPKQALREFTEGGLDDTACLEATIARLETDTGTMVERANAWAVGDVQTLLERRFDDDIRACATALLGTDALKKRGIADLPRKLVAEWVRVADEALAEVPTSVAVADLRLLVADDGLLAGLKAKGYRIYAPGEETPVDAAAGSDPVDAGRSPIEAGGRVEPTSD